MVQCIDNMSSEESDFHRKMVCGDIVKDNGINFIAKSLQHDTFLTLDASQGITFFSNFSLFKMEECLTCSETNLRCRDISEYRLRYCVVDMEKAETGKIKLLNKSIDIV